MFGWYGGMGDPPSDNDIEAILKGADEFALNIPPLTKDLKPEEF